MPKFPSTYFERIKTIKKLELSILAIKPKPVPALLRIPKIDILHVIYEGCNYNEDSMGFILEADHILVDLNKNCKLEPFIERLKPAKTIVFNEMPQGKQIDRKLI